MSDDDNEVDAAAQKAQQELLERRDRLTKARKELEEKNDPWGGQGQSSIDPDKLGTGVADAGHSIAKGLEDLGDSFPGGQVLSAAGKALHDVANLNDRDNDGLTDGQELKRGTNPNDRDTDNDGLDDGVEVKKYHSNPKSADSDRDGRSDFEEASGSMRYTLQGEQVPGSAPQVTTPAPRPSDITFDTSDSDWDGDTRPAPVQGGTGVTPPANVAPSPAEQDLGFAPVEQPAEQDLGFAPVEQPADIVFSDADADWVGDATVPDPAFAPPDDGGLSSSEMDPGFTQPDVVFSEGDADWDGQAV